MSSVICTLFEGHYHYGLAGLANSLFRNGFKGSIYAGFRGQIPEWASSSIENSLLNWKGGRTLTVIEGLQIHFLPLETECHFANYKPDFLLELLNNVAKDAENIYYFDPDIVIVQPWSCFEEWVTCGVAVSEDVNSPLAKYNPRRVAWRRIFKKYDIQLNFKNSIYVNSGFIGIKRENQSFIENWKMVQDKISPLVGGLNHSIFNKEHLRHLEKIGGPFMPLVKTDQDALNISIEIANDEISFLGKDGMGFEHGFNLMHHALGSDKPWKSKPIINMLNGKPPRNVDVKYWMVADGPISTFSKSSIFRQKLLLKIAAAVGRIYRKG